MKKSLTAYVRTYQRWKAATLCGRLSNGNDPFLAASILHYTIILLPCKPENPGGGI